MFVLVIDIDAGTDEKTGEIFEAAAIQIELERELGIKLPHTRAHRTPRGGVHLFYYLSEGTPPVGNRAGLIPHVDVRGQGGYVILPPSARVDGRHYELIDDVPIAAAPAALVDCILRQGKWQRDRARDKPARAAERRSISQRAAPADVGAENCRRYAEAALQRECSAIAGTRQGSRNDRLNIGALKLGELVGAACLSERTVRARLEDAAEACGLAAADGWPSVRATIDSGLRKGMSQPRDLAEIREKARAPGGRPHRSASALWSAPGGDAPAASPRPASSFRSLPSEQSCSRIQEAVGGKGGGPPGDRPPDGDGDDEFNRGLALLSLDDLGNAERVVARKRDKLLRTTALGWLAWDFRRFTRDGALELVDLAVHDAIRAIAKEADALAGTADDYVTPKGNRSDEVRHWARTSRSAGHIGPLTRPERHGGLIGPYFQVDPSTLDADGMMINVENGTVIIRKTKDGSPYVTLKPHDPRDRITKLANVVYDTSARCPVYDEFLAYIQPNPATRRLLHQWGGYSSTGDTSEQKLFFCWGRGKNGKSTLLDIWRHILGDYAKTIPIESFINEGRGRNAGQATPDLAMTLSIRFLTASEPERGAKLAEALIKLITGGEPMPVRHLNREYFMLRPVFKLTISGNYRPKIEGADEGIWRRVVLVPFLVTIPEEKQDKHLIQKLKAESSGIFNRLLDGLCDWLDNGLTQPEDVIGATAEYRRDSDPLGQFLAACVVAKEGERVRSKQMLELFCAWARSNGEREWTGNYLGRVLKERGFKSKHSNVNYWLDVMLTKSPTDFEEAGSGLGTAEPAGGDIEIE